MEMKHRLRNLEWIESIENVLMKQRIGKVGYVYVPSTGVEDGQYDW